MVNKLWFRELGRKWFQTRPEPPPARRLTEPGCQAELRAWYLAYRWLVFLLWLSVVLCSLLEIGSSSGVDDSPASGDIVVSGDDTVDIANYDETTGGGSVGAAKGGNSDPSSEQQQQQQQSSSHQSSSSTSSSRELWPIYLTNWDLTLGLLQALLGACLCTRRWALQRRAARRQRGHQANKSISTTTTNGEAPFSIAFDPDEHLTYGPAESLYWLLYVITSSLALGVTVTYWGLVHDPRYHRVDLLNLLIHVGNSLLMILDFCVAYVPFVGRSFWWTPALVLAYLGFSLVYYAAGGLDKRGQHRIYDVLDWEKPGRTLLVCAGGLAFIVLIHCCLCYLAGARDGAYERRRRRTMSGGGGDDTAAHQDGKKDELQLRRKNESIV